MCVRVRGRGKNVHRRKLNKKKNKEYKEEKKENSIAHIESYLQISYTY